MENITHMMMDNKKGLTSFGLFAIAIFIGILILTTRFLFDWAPSEAPHLPWAGYPVGIIDFWHENKRPPDSLQELVPFHLPNEAVSKIKLYTEADRIIIESLESDEGETFSLTVWSSGSDSYHYELRTLNIVEKRDVKPSNG